jgi:uncharacterized protein
MTDFTWWCWAALAASAFLLGVSKTGLPGVGILAIILSAAAIPARVSTGLILPLLIVGDILAVSFYRRHAVWKHILRIIPYAIIGILIGYLAMGYVNDTQLRRIIGGIALVLLALNAWRNRYATDAMAIPSRWWFAAVLGLMAGITTMMANAAGPIMIIYLLAMRLPKEQFVGTGAWYFFLLNCFKVPFSIDLGLINPDSLWLNLQMVPFIVVGALTGVLLVKRIPEKHFNTIVQWLALAGAIKLLF